MAEVWFYHLDKQPLEHVLPRIVASSIAKGWPMVIETALGDRVLKLSELLWASEDVSFLPHGFEGEPNPAAQPVWITASAENPNNAVVRVFLDGATPGDLTHINRAVLMFNGNEASAIEAARAEWKIQKSAGHNISYWKQDENGKWINQANQN
jgi:DNA polymerase III subunit chi